MERISIKYIGPIEKCEFNVKPINIFIGPQATGKSTIAKIVLYFKSFHDNLISAFEVEQINQLLEDKFKRILGAYLTDKTEISYFFSPKVWIRVRYKKESIKIEFSEKLNNRISEILKLRKSKEDGLLWHLIVKENLRTELKKILPEITREEVPLFIPAGRLIYSFLPEQTTIDRLALSSNLEPMMADFDWKKEVIKDFIHKFQKEDKLMEIIGGILKAKINIEEKRIILRLNGKNLPIKFASSGQQELLWVFLTIIYLILNKKSSFLVIEEPEAHLFPDTQKELVELLALLHNLTNTELLITTHSPYILTSFNNLIYAHAVASKCRKKTRVSRIVDKRCWIDPHKVNAFYVDRGKIKNIIDDELKIIKAETIDTISKKINREFEKLLDIEAGETA